jgi:hypothetical protein
MSTATPRASQSAASFSRRSRLDFSLPPDGHSNFQAIVRIWSQNTGLDLRILSHRILGGVWLHRIHVRCRFLTVMHDPGTTRFQELSSRMQMQAPATGSHCPTRHRAIDCTRMAARGVTIIECYRKSRRLTTDLEDRIMCITKSLARLRDTLLKLARNSALVVLSSMSAIP